MLVFWRKGYEGASMSDLTASLGVTKPSLYAAFGNKEQLFRAVLDRYDKRTAHFLSGSIRAATAREVAVGLLRGAAEFHANPANPPGCLMVQGALVGSDSRRFGAAGDSRSPQPSARGDPGAARARASRG